MYKFDFQKENIIINCKDKKIIFEENKDNKWDMVVFPINGVISRQNNLTKYQAIDATKCLSKNYSVIAEMNFRDMRTYGNYRHSFTLFPNGNILETKLDMFYKHHNHEAYNNKSMTFEEMEVEWRKMCSKYFGKTIEKLYK